MEAALMHVPVLARQVATAAAKAAADPARVEMIRWTGYAFIAFGVAYLAYRWFSDR